MIRVLATASHVTALLVLSVLSFRLWRNLRFLRRAGRMRQLPAEPMRVSVLVPARDEAQNVAACIKSLARQDYPDFEVVALDDQSADETGALLDDLAARHANVSVVHGTETPPAGWNGKSYACQRLAERATGEWLLFTDADTRHAPTSIAQGVAQAAALRADLLSVFPRQVTESWSEKVVVSFVLDFLPLVATDLSALWRGESSGTAANGQYLLVRASVYRAVGGHAAIRQALVDDFALAKRIRASGYTVALVDGTAMLSCRMYHDFGEVWQGFSKNILLALETSSDGQRPRWWGLLFAWGYAAVFVLPFFWLRFTRHRRLALLEIGWLGALRAVVGWRFGRPLIEILTTPLAAWSVMALGLAAFVRRKRGGRVRWKGRGYTLSG